MLLENTYGIVQSNYKFKIETHPANFVNSPYYDKLTEIYRSLENHRGFKDITKAKTLPNCDFYMPKDNFVLEFDETQHFTLPRKIALEHYPKELKLGFDRTKWITLCKKIDAKDNNPPFRDEQRAWYDTLRDFLPELITLRPTVRVFSRDFEWCSLDPTKPQDVAKFKLYANLF